MAIKVSSVKCPNCGANVSYDGSSKTGKCEFCNTVLDFTEEYGPKNDRMRDDIQDMQIKHIMNNMNGTGRSSANINKAKNTALLIVLCIVGAIILFNIVGSFIYAAVVGGLMAQSKKSSGSAASQEVEIDPFAKVEISYTGISGEADGWVHDRNVHAISVLEKSTGKLEGLSNGDTITISYPSDRVKDGNKTYIFTRTENTYTVSGLDEYVGNIYDVGEEDLETMKKNAIALAKSQCDEDFSCYLPGTFEVCAIYSMVKRDYSKQDSVFVVSFDYQMDGAVNKGYFMAEYPNVTKLASGDYRINFNPDVYIYGRESYYMGFCLTSAHSTWDATYAEVYLNNKADWFVNEDYISDELKQ